MLVYEVIRVAAIHSRVEDADELQALSRPFGELLERLDSSFVPVREARAASSEVVTSGVSSELLSLRSVLEKMDAAFVGGDPDALVAGLVEAKYAVGRLMDEVAVSTASLLDSNASESGEFNELTHVVVAQDERSVRFFGVNNPSGPVRPIPYVSVMAAAVRLPDESGEPALVGSVPGFSLEPTSASREVIAGIRQQLRDLSPDAVAARGNRLNQAALAANMESAMTQALPRIREALKLLLSTRVGRHQADERMDGIASVDELSATLEELLQEGVFKETDGPTLNRLMVAGIQSFQTTPGNVLSFPGFGADGAAREKLLVVPVFYGIQSDTQLARIVFESDVALKSIFGSGKNQLQEVLSFHQTYLEWRLRRREASEWTGLQDPYIVFQILPRRISLAVSRDGRAVSIETAEMEIAMRTRDSAGKLSPDDRSYGDFLSAHFDDYAREIDSLWEIREAAKVVAVARHLQARGIVLDEPPDRSWSPPPTVEATWDAATVGTGANDFVYASMLVGGVGLHVEKRTEVTVLHDTAARELSASAGQAPGQAVVALSTELAFRDPAAARARIRELPARQLEELKAEATADAERLAEQIDRIRRREFELQLKAASPPDFRTWRDAAEEMVEQLPGVSFMEDLGASAAKSLDGASTGSAEKPIDWQRVEKSYQKGTDDVMKARGWLNSAATLLDETSGGPKSMVETSLVVLRESALAYRAIEESDNWTDATVAALPHAGKALETLPANVATFFPTTGAAPGSARALQAARVTQSASRANGYLAVGKVAIGLAHEAANIAIVNEGLRDEAAANRVLLLNVAENRAMLERRRKGRLQLLDLMEAERPSQVR